MSTKRILVGLGLEACSETATKYAIELAQRSGGALTGVTLIDTPSLTHAGPTPLGGGAYASQLSTERSAAAHKLASRVAKQFRRACVDSKTPYTVRWEEGDPIRSLIAVSRYHDLAIVGRDGLCEHGVIDEPPDELVRLVGGGVRPMVVAPPEHRPIRKVLVAYSGSIGSAKALRQFVQFGLWPDAELTIVHFARRDRGDGADLLADADDYCRAHGLSVQTELCEGGSRHAVLDFAGDCGADLIVMGNSARRLMLRRLLGETMLQTVRNSDLPLFLSQ